MRAHRPSLCLLLFSLHIDARRDRREGAKGGDFVRRKCKHPGLTSGRVLSGLFVIENHFNDTPLAFIITAFGGMPSPAGFECVAKPAGK
jgi:hypothetical protein